MTKNLGKLNHIGGEFGCYIASRGLPCMISKDSMVAAITITMIGVLFSPAEKMASL